MKKVSEKLFSIYAVWMVVGVVLAFLTAAFSRIFLIPIGFLWLALVLILLKMKCPHCHSSIFPLNEIARLGRLTTLLPAKCRVCNRDF